MVSKNVRALITVVIIKTSTVAKSVAGYMWFITEMKGLNPMWKIRPKCECNQGGFFKKNQPLPIKNSQEVWKKKHSKP